MEIRKGVRLRLGLGVGVGVFLDGWEFEGMGGCGWGNVIVQTVRGLLPD